MLVVSLYFPAAFDGGFAAVQCPLRRRVLVSKASIPYDREYALSRSSPVDNWLFDVIIRLLSPQPGWRVLDVGCNTGELVARLAQLKCDATGIDISGDAIAIAKQRFPDGAFHVADLTQLPEREFDVIIASHVIEHLSQPEEFLFAARQRLKSSGTLLIVTPNRYALLHRFLHGIRGIPIFHDPTHVRLFSPVELRDLMRRAGFEQLRLRTYLLYFPFVTRLPARVRSRLPALGMGDHLVALSCGGDAARDDATRRLPARRQT